MQLVWLAAFPGHSNLTRTNRRPTDQAEQTVNRWRQRRTSGNQVSNDTNLTNYVHYQKQDRGKQRGEEVTGHAVARPDRTKRLLPAHQALVPYMSARHLRTLSRTSPSAITRSAKRDVPVSRFGLAVSNRKSVRFHFGSPLSSVSCGLWTLSCDFVPHN